MESIAGKGVALQGDCLTTFTSSVVCSPAAINLVCPGGRC